MFCHTCQKEFNPWVNQYGWEDHEYCPSCYDDRFSGKTLHYDHFCINCGLQFPKRERKNRNGKIYLTSAGIKICADCRELLSSLNKPEPRRCIVCEVLLTGHAYKYCPEHKPTKVIVDPIIHRRTSIAWQKNNPKKVKAAQFTRYRPDQVFVLYECPCDHPKKHNHHFNYELKNIVIRLCPACHAAEHKRLRSLSPEALAVNE